MNEENKEIDESISETPSFDPFADLSDEKKEEIKKYVTKWQNATVGTGEKETITLKVKKILNDREYEYYKYLKTAKKKSSTKKKLPTLTKQEAIAKEEFAKILREYIKDNLYLNKKIDWVNGVFELGPRFNLPSYFWIRMTTQVLLVMKKEEKGNEKSNLHSWLLAAGILKEHKQEFADILQKTNFKDIEHVSNSIIFLINKYLLPTYKRLMEEAKKQAVSKKLSSKEIKEKDMFSNIDNKDIVQGDNKKEGGIKRIRKISLD